MKNSGSSTVFKYILSISGLGISIMIQEWDIYMEQKPNVLSPSLLLEKNWYMYIFLLDPCW